MKFNLKEKLESADDDILADLIGKCEQKMTSKFKPKAEVAVVEVEPEEESEEDGEEEIGEEDLAALLQALSKAKG